MSCCGRLAAAEAWRRTRPSRSETSRRVRPSLLTSPSPSSSPCRHRRHPWSNGAHHPTTSPARSGPVRVSSTRFPVRDLCFRCRRFRVVSSAALEPLSSPPPLPPSSPSYFPYTHTHPHTHIHIHRGPNSRGSAALRTAQRRRRHLPFSSFLALSPCRCLGDCCHGCGLPDGGQTHRRHSAFVPRFHRPPPSHKPRSMTPSPFVYTH